MKQRILYLTLAATSVIAFTSVFSVAMAQTAGAGAVAGSNSSAGAISSSTSGSIGLGLGGSSNGGASNANNSISFDNHSVGSDLSDQVPTMFIPNLTTSNGTCANSFSMGGSGAGFGVAFGKTYVSGPCNARFNANQLSSLGMQDLAMETMCGIKSVYEADQRLKDMGQIPKCVDKNPPEVQPVADTEIGPDGQPVVVWFADAEMGEVNQMAMNDASISDPNSNDMTDYELGSMYAEMYGDTPEKVWGGQYPEVQTNR